MVIRLHNYLSWSPGPLHTNTISNTLWQHTEVLTSWDNFPALPRYPCNHSWLGILCGTETNFSYSPQAGFEPTSLELDRSSIDHWDHCAVSAQSRYHIYRTVYLVNNLKDDVLSHLLWTVKNCKSALYGIIYFQLWKTVIRNSTRLNVCVNVSFKPTVPDN